MRHPQEIQTWDAQLAIINKQLDQSVTRIEQHVAAWSAMAGYGGATENGSVLPQRVQQADELITTTTECNARVALLPSATAPTCTTTATALDPTDSPSRQLQEDTTAVMRTAVQTYLNVYADNTLFAWCQETAQQLKSLRSACTLLDASVLPLMPVQAKRSCAQKKALLTGTMALLSEDMKQLSAQRSHVARMDALAKGIAAKKQRMGALSRYDAVKRNQPTMDERVDDAADALLQSVHDELNIAALADWMNVFDEQYAEHVVTTTETELHNALDIVSTMDKCTTSTRAADSLQNTACVEKALVAHALVKAELRVYRQQYSIRLKTESRSSSPSLSSSSSSQSSVCSRVTEALLSEVAMVHANFIALGRETAVNGDQQHRKYAVGQLMVAALKQKLDTLAPTTTGPLSLITEALCNHAEPPQGISMQQQLDTTGVVVVQPSDITIASSTITTAAGHDIPLNDSDSDDNISNVSETSPTSAHQSADDEHNENDEKPPDQTPPVDSETTTPTPTIPPLPHASSDEEEDVDQHTAEEPSMSIDNDVRSGASIIPVHVEAATAATIAVPPDLASHQEVEEKDAAIDVLQTVSADTTTTGTTTTTNNDDTELEDAWDTMLGEDVPPDLPPVELPKVASEESPQQQQQEEDKGAEEIDIAAAATFVHPSNTTGDDDDYSDAAMHFQDTSSDGDPMLMLLAPVCTVADAIRVPNVEKRLERIRFEIMGMLLFRFRHMRSYIRWVG